WPWDSTQVRLFIGQGGDEPCRVLHGEPIGVPTSSEFGQHETEGPNVLSAGRIRIDHRFRGHVLQGADGSVCSERGHLLAPCYAEVHDSDRVIGSHTHVRGLQVAVNQTLIRKITYCPD